MLEVKQMQNEIEVINTVKTKDLRYLKDLTREVFSKIGTEKSRQRLVYDLLNALKTGDRKRFLWLILKNVNNIKSEDNKANKLADILGNLYIEYETPENFEKMSYSIVLGIMSIEQDKGGEKNG